MKKIAAFLLLLLLVGCTSSRPGRDNTGSYTAEGMISFVRPAETADLAAQFREDHPEKIDWTSISGYRAVTRWLNANLPDGYKYRPDGPKDHWRTPRITLQNLGGDCEDHSVLVASFLVELGCDQEIRIIFVRLANGHRHVLTSVSVIHEVKEKLKLHREYILDSYPFWLKQGMTKGTIVVRVAVVKR